MKSILLYNVYLLNHWKKVTRELLADVPQDDIYVNLSFDLRYIYRIPLAIIFLKKNYPKIRKVFITENNAKYGEVLGFEKFRKRISYDKYDILTYIHSKGVTKPHNPYENDWRELMRYFILDRFDLTIKAFGEGYQLYGVNLSEYKGKDEDRKHAYKEADFWYRGNFVSINLKKLKNNFLNTKINPDFYAVEGFWGKLCDISQAYCVHESGLSHYKYPYPKEKYESKQL